MSALSQFILYSIYKDSKNSQSDHTVGCYITYFPVVAPGLMSQCQGNFAFFCLTIFQLLHHNTDAEGMLNIIFLGSLSVNPWIVFLMVVSPVFLHMPVQSLVLSGIIFLFIILISIFGGLVNVESK